MATVACVAIGVPAATLSVSDAPVRRTVTVIVPAVVSIAVTAPAA